MIEEALEIEASVIEEAEEATVAIEKEAITDQATTKTDQKENFQQLVDVSIVENKAT